MSFTTEEMKLLTNLIHKLVMIYDKIYRTTNTDTDFTLEEKANIKKLRDRLSQ